MKKICYLFFLLLILVLPGCSQGPENPGAAGDSTAAGPDANADSRTILIYMCGSNLETTFGAATKNIAEMLSVKLPQGVNVIIQTGGAKKWRDYDIPANQLCRYTLKNNQLVLLESLERSNMGYVSTFYDFLDYGFEKFPAQKTAVILWDHGSGCVNGMISDENAAGSLSIADLQTAFTDAEKKHGTYVDLIGMDACLMANFETACALRDCADYMLASEEIEPTGGWDYQAFFSALAKNKDSSAEELGKAVCDGFCEKYAESDSSYATLSVIDLSKISAAADAFNSAMHTLTEKEIEVQDIRYVADSADHAVRVGANSQYTGYSNLIDMVDFVEYYSNQIGNSDFLGAVNDCIVYSAESQDNRDYGGLSFFYPLNYADDSFRKYYEEICPVPAYKAYLEKVFTNMPEEPIKIKDVSVTENGSLRVDVTDESLPYILEKEYFLYEILDFDEEAEDPSEAVTYFKVVSMIDNDISVENDGRTYISNFRGVSPCLNGVPLTYYFVGKKNANTYIFESLVKVNGEYTNLRFSFVFDESEFNGGHYEIIGLWDGVDYATGMLDKGIRPLKVGDEVESVVILGGRGLPEDADPNDESANEKVPKSDDGYQITEEPLKGKYYLYSMDLVDIYGRIPLGVTVQAIVEMTKSYEELKERPLADGESAGKVISMWIEGLS